MAAPSGNLVAQPVANQPQERQGLVEAVFILYFLSNCIIDFYIEENPHGSLQGKTGW